MKRSALLSLAFVFLGTISAPVAILAQASTVATLPLQTQAPRSIELPDILAWKRIAGAVVSNDGQFFAHKITPNEGDGEVVLRRLKDAKEWRFPIGEATGGGGDMAFSDDGKWFALTVYPTFKEGKKLKKERKPLQNKVTLINLANEQKTEFEKIRRFAFAGEMSSWLALLKYGPDGGGPPAAGPPPGSPVPDKATGADLILQELATGSELNLGNVADFAFNKKGDWLAFTIDANEKSGNGLQARNMVTGALLPLDSDKALYRGLNWTENGDALAVVKGAEDKGYEEKLYSVVGISFATGTPEKTVYDHKKDASFPVGMTISANRNPTWTEDLSGLVFGIQDVKAKKEDKKPDAKDAKPDPAAAPKKPEDEAEKPDLVLWHWQDTRLQAQQQVEETRDKNFSYLATYLVAEKKFLRLADDTLRNVNPAPKQRFAIGSDARSYELMGSLDGRSYTDVYVVDMKTGSRKLALKKARWTFAASPDGTHFLYYEDGNFLTYDMTTGQSYNLTKNIPSNFYDEEDDHNNIKPPAGPVGWTKDGRSVLLSDNWDFWNVPAHGGAATNLTVNGKRDKIHYLGRIRLDADEKGADLDKPLYYRAIGAWTKKTGLARVESGKPGAQMLTWDDASYGSLMKAKRADTYLFTRETYAEPPAYYLSDATLGNAQKLTDSNPQQKNFNWSSGSKLIDYTSAKGDKLQGALYLPANYQPGKSYPTVVYIYEKLSQGLNSYASPTYNGFNKSVYTSNGYAVLMPDIKYKLDDPGMSAVWCILPALQAAIATGVVDKDHVALHGHSWGGYQTAFMVTQTDAFRAAIAGAPLTDMISMYNLVYWNSGSGNMAIFESSQGRFTGSPVDNPAAYIRNSPVFHAKNVKTPLMILHNDKDGAVDFTQGIEYYNQLRRLQKPVVMLQYKGENHGLRVPANMKDYTIRMKEFLDHHLKGAPAPKWLTEGVPLLKLKDHLDERAKDKAPMEENP